MARTENREPLVNKISVKDIMNSPIISASPDSNAKELADIMRKADVGCVVIMDNEKFVGIVTDKDLISRVATKDEVPSEISAKATMRPLHTIDA